VTTELPTVDDDLLTEGAPEAEFNPGIAARLPSKNVAAAAVIRDEQGRVLLLEAVYKPTWVMPGGVVEENEDPRSGCRRELLEELRLDREPGRLLVVDWVPRHGVWGEQLQFVFDGGVLSGAEIEAIELQESELSGLHFVATDDVGRVPLTPSLNRRLVQSLDALAHGTTDYTTYGRPSR